VHSCCHGIIKLGDPTVPVADLWTRLEKSERACRNCSMFPCM